VTSSDVIARLRDGVVVKCDQWPLTRDDAKLLLARIDALEKVAEACAEDHHEMRIRSEPTCPICHALAALEQTRATKGTKP
jgi:hypothetical protein